MKFLINRPAEVASFLRRPLMCRGKQVRGDFGGECRWPVPRQHDISYLNGGRILVVVKAKLTAVF